MSNKTQLQTNNTNYASLIETLRGKAIGGGSEPAEPILQKKTITPSTATQSVLPDNGYDGLSMVTVNAIPSTYVQPTSRKAATTYTPSTSNQTIPAGTYCTGVQTIKGDANLVAENIVSGKSIFGVAGTATTGGGGSGSVEACTVTITTSDPFGEGIFHYTDATTLTIKSYQYSGGTVTLSVPVNTIIAIEYWSSVATYSGACSQIFFMQGYSAYKVTGNCTFTYMM